MLNLKSPIMQMSIKNNNIINYLQTNKRFICDNPVEIIPNETIPNEIIKCNVNQEMVIEQKMSYTEVYDISNLEKGLERTKSNVATGLDGETKANYSLQKLEKLSKELKSHSYKPSPVKRV